MITTSLLPLFCSLIVCVSRLQLLCGKLEIDDWQSQSASLQTELKTVKAAAALADQKAATQIATLTGEVTTLKAEKQVLSVQLAAQTEAKGRSDTALATAQATITTRSSELAEVRAELEKVKAERDTKAKDVRATQLLPFYLFCSIDGA